MVMTLMRMKFMLTTTKFTDDNDYRVHDYTRIYSIYADIQYAYSTYMHHTLPNPQELRMV